MKIVYSISNPSDACTLLAPDLATAAAAILMLGEGAYGLVDEHGVTAMPVFLLGGGPEWIKENFGGEYGDLLKQAGWTAIAACLESVLLGTIRDRKVYEAALDAARPEAVATLRSTWAELHERSSLNDIAAHAKRLATGIREMQAQRV